MSIINYRTCFIVKEARLAKMYLYGTDRPSILKIYTSGKGVCNGSNVDTL